MDDKTKKSKKVVIIKIQDNGINCEGKKVVVLWKHLSEALGGFSVLKAKLWKEEEQAVEWKSF